MRRFLAVTGLVVFVAICAIALIARSPVRGTALTPTGEMPLATADPAVTSRVNSETERARLARDDRETRRVVVVRGLLIPIDGATLPTDLELLPNAARDYRAGWHEGIDFAAKAGTPVRAVAAGVVIRIDDDYLEWDADARSIALEEAQRLGYTPSRTLDLIRGRQVWIDHGHGIASRYAHLSAVANLRAGDAVEAGAVIGTVGSTGYPEGGPHLHLEIRVGSSYLADGLAGDALLAAINAAFD